MNNNKKQWLHHLEELQRLYNEGAAIHLPAFDRHQSIKPLQDKYNVVLCSPHPDDEALTASLFLRLQQSDFHTLNLGMTLGSDLKQQRTRLAELHHSCQILGFDTLPVQEPLAFNSLFDDARERSTAWNEKVNTLIDHFNHFSPLIISCPHEEDGHPTHQTVYHLVREAALKYSSDSGTTILFVETEFWYPMHQPNLLLGIRPEEAAISLAALTCHQSQTSRNPYHLRLPARYIDTVRRSTELAAYGSTAPDFLFGELYRVSCVKNGTLQTQNSFNIIPPEQGLNHNALAELYTFTE